jgi:hypothetical protein
LGVSENIGDRSGFVVLCARGQYDASAVQAMLAKTNFMSPEKVGDIQLWTPPNGRDAAFFFPSNEHAVFMAGPTRDQLPSQSMSEAFKAGQNPKGIKTNARIMKLMSSIDTTEALWGVAIIQGIFRKEIPQLEEFDSITLVGKREKAATIFEAKGEGKDTTKVAAAAGTINKQIEEARKNIADMVPKPMFPALKPILNFLESMKCEAQGTTATLKARFEGDNPGQLLMMLGFWTVAPIRAAPPPPPPNK